MVIVRSLLVLLVAMAAGCSLVNDPGMHTGGAMVRFAHLARQTDNVNVYANGRLIAEGAEFSTVGVPIPVPSGTVVFRVTRAETNDVVLERSLQTDPEEAYTLTLFGDESPPPELLPLRTLGLLLLRDDRSDFDPMPDVRLNVVHVASPVETGALVAIAPNGDQARLISEFGFGASAQLAPPSQALTVGFDARTDGSIDAQFDLPPLPAGTYATVFIAARDDGSVFLLVSRDNDTLEFSPPRVRVANLSRDVGPVDVYAGRQQIATALAFPTVGQDFYVSGQNVTFRVTRTGSMDTLLTQTPTTEQNQSYTLAVYGDAVGPTALALLLVRTDTSGLEGSDDLRLAAVNVATPVRSGSLVFVNTAGAPEPFAPEFRFGTVTVLTRRARTGLSLGLDAQNNGSTDFQFSFPNLTAGAYANVFVAARGDDTPFLLVNTDGNETDIVEPN